MALFKHWQGSRYSMQLTIINLVACFACLCGIAFAQLEFSEALTGSVGFPDVAIACLGNLAVFFTCILRGRLDLDIGARDVLATNRGPKLMKTQGGEDSGLTTCNANVEGRTKYEDAAVLMLSTNTSDSSIAEFMRYIHHSHGLDSILLKYLPLSHSDTTTVERCDCDPFLCGCILLWTEEEEMRMMIARRLPGTLKRLSDSQCLLPSWKCLINGCHGFDQGLLHVKQNELERMRRLREEESAQIQAEYTELQPDRRLREEESPATPFRELEIHVKDTEAEESHDEIHVKDTEAEAEAERRLKEEESKAESHDEIHVDVNDTEQQRLTEEGSRATSPAAVCQILDRYGYYYYLLKEHGCICIPLREADEDEWTKLLIRFMRSKDKEGRGVRVFAADAMEKYIDWSGESVSVTTDTISEYYTGFSLLVQRLIEVIVNFLLTGWLRVDGLSSALIARRVVRDYLVDSKGTAFTANAFLTSAYIKCNESSVCQLLCFRGSILGVRTLAYVGGCVNLICSLAWCVLIASEGSVGKRYGIQSMSPSKYRLIVILIGIAIALLMDSFNLWLLYVLKAQLLFSKKIREVEESRVKKNIRMVWGVMGLEIIYMVAGCVLIVKGLTSGKWVYSALQILVWVKWGIGSYLLGDRDDRVEYDRIKKHFNEAGYFDLSMNHGVMVYSSAFMLNAILAGVRGKWGF